MSGVSSSSGEPNSGSSDADARVANEGAGAALSRDSRAGRPNSASNPEDARRAVPASINARSSRPSGLPDSGLIGRSGSDKAGASANSYPQLRQRSAVSNPTYPHLEHFTAGAPPPGAGARAGDRRAADRRRASADPSSGRLRARTGHRERRRRPRGSRARASAVSPRRGSASTTSRVTGAIVAAERTLGRPSTPRQSPFDATAPYAPTPTSTMSVTSDTASPRPGRPDTRTDGGAVEACRSIGDRGCTGAAGAGSMRLSRSSIGNASSSAAPPSMAACSSRRASPASPRRNAAAPPCSNSSACRCRSAIALRARSMYARARAWLRSKNSARVQTLMASS